MQSIRAKLSKIIYSSDGYKVAIFKTVEGCEKSSFVAYGKLPSLSKEEIVIEGEFKHNEKHGLQFEVMSWKRPVPRAREQLIAYFSSSLFKGCGKRMAEKIVDALGSQAIQRISKEGYKCLLQIKGMKKELAIQISETTQRSFVLNDLIDLYAKYGISSDLILKAYTLMGQNINELYYNPYPLVHYKLIHFHTADTIARQMNILPHALERLETVFRLILKYECTLHGHIYLNERLFIEKCLFILNQYAKQEDKLTVLDVIQGIETSKLIVAEEGRIYPSFLYHFEKKLAKKIHLLIDSEKDYNPNEVDKKISLFEQTSQQTLTSEQKQAIHQLLMNNFLILTGGPGTGKTFTINAILQVYKSLFPNHSISLAAPTGRAAKHLGEITGFERHAQTIHKLLGIGHLGSHRPMYNHEQPLEHKLIIVDEFSMVDTQLAFYLFDAIKKGTKILIVGDPDQLPSIGAGNVLKDLLEAGLPQVRLSRIFRQAQDSRIVTNAHKINQGIMIDLENTHDHYFIESNDDERTAVLLVRSVQRFLEKGYSLSDIMILSPMKKGILGIENLNEMIREAVNPKKKDCIEVTYGSQTFRTGDKVMYIRNNREADIYNGDIGIIRQVYPNKSVEVDFQGKLVLLEKEELQDLQLAYCSTIHKVQGGQAPIVLIVLSHSHSVMLMRNLFYTAITRAKNLFVLFSERSVIEQAIQNNHVADRNTTLKHRLLGLQVAKSK